MTRIRIDTGLVEEALSLGGLRTRKATVENALHEYVQRRKQLRIIDLFGKVEFDAKYDHKRQRRGR